MGPYTRAAVGRSIRLLDVLAIGLWNGELR